VRVDVGADVACGCCVRKCVRKNNSLYSAFRNFGRKAEIGSFMRFLE